MGIGQLCVVVFEEIRINNNNNNNNSIIFYGIVSDSNRRIIVIIIIIIIIMVNDFLYNCTIVVFEKIVNNVKFGGLQPPKYSNI